MILQELFIKLRDNTPNTRQFVWIVDVPEPTDGGIVSALSRADCELEDKIRVREDAIYIGTTTSLANQLQLFTLEQITSDWATVCDGVDSIQTLLSDS